MGVDAIRFSRSTIRMFVQLNTRVHDAHRAWPATRQVRYQAWQQAWQSSGRVSKQAGEGDACGMPLKYGRPCRTDGTKSRRSMSMIYCVPQRVGGEDLCVCVYVCMCVCVCVCAITEERRSAQIGTRNRLCTSHAVTLEELEVTDRFHQKQAGTFHAAGG